MASRAALAATVGMLLLAAAGCAAPLVVPTERTSETSGPDPTVQVTTRDGASLRGEFVESKGATHVVLHLLPRRMTVRDGFRWAFGTQRADGTMAHLRRHGLSSLALDYRGAGWSPGDTDSMRLPEDGAAMWAEAVRRAGGDPSRVIVRATSLGTLVTADLLARGARPGALVLYAPVRAETVVAHGMRVQQGAFLGTITAAFLRTPFDHDLTDVLRTVSCPTLVVLSTDDPLLPPEERALLRAATASNENVTIVERPEGHEALALRAFGYATEADEDRGSFSGHALDHLPEEELRFLLRVPALSTR